MVCQKRPICEPVDLPPQKIYNHGCVSHENVTLNYCVAKNGACSASDGSAVDYDYFTGVSALWDEFHVLRTFCKCCTDSAAEKREVEMDCTDQTATQICSKIYAAKVSSLKTDRSTLQKVV